MTRRLSPLRRGVCRWCRQPIAEYDDAVWGPTWTHLRSDRDRRNAPDERRTCWAPNAEPDDTLFEEAA